VWSDFHIWHDINKLYIKKVLNIINERVFLLCQSKKAAISTTAGHVNRNNQVNLGRLNEKGTDFGQYFYLMDKASGKKIGKELIFSFENN